MSFLKHNQYQVYINRRLVIIKQDFRLMVHLDETFSIIQEKELDLP